MKTIVVLGMHRAATSLVARTLNHEVHMGEKLLKGLRDNPKGHYENVRILKLNDKILHDAGGSYFNPPSVDNILKAAHKFEDEMRTVVEKEIEAAEKKGMESWGFKDPRTCLTIEAWLPYLPNPQFVVCYRDPLEIAKSLNKRDGMSIKKGIELTKEYNNRIINFINNWLNYV